MSQDQDDQVADLSSPDVVDKYKTAADIANRVMTTLLEASKVGASIFELCKKGDELIQAEVAVVYTKNKKLEKGVAFPTSISVNNIVGHFSPIIEEGVQLKEGDLVKIDLAVHIDGFISTLAHSFIATNEPTTVTTGSKADVICAAHFAGEAALRLLKPGNKNTQITEVIRAVADQFKVNPVEGVLSHQLKRFVIDGNRVIMNKEASDVHAEEFTFEEGEVYSIDIVMTSGEGKTRDYDAKTAIFKRAVDQNYLLKLTSARAALKEIETKHGALAFNVRSLSDAKHRLGLIECVRHNLFTSYPVLAEKPDAVVGQFKFTALILPSGIQKLASVPLPYVTSAYSITDPKISALLQQGLKRSSKKKPNKKKKAAAASADQQPSSTTGAPDAAPDQ